MIGLGAVVGAFVANDRNVRTAAFRPSPGRHVCIEHVAMPNQGAAFIRETVDNELDRREGQSENPIQTGGEDEKQR